MPLPVIDSRPEKTINNVLSRWNAANLPMIYDISNTKWPTNTEDAQVNFIVVSDNDGFARFATGVAGIADVKGWVTISGSTLYDGIHQVTGTTAAGLNYILNTPFIATDTGQIQKYYQNYTLLIRVNAGIDPGHTHAATKPIELIGTIEQRPDSTTGITLVDVKKYVKNKLNFNYDESQASFPNDLNAWADFYIAVAERFDAVVDGLVVDSVSVFTNDAEGVYSDIIFLKAAASSLPFGYPFGGNLGEYVIDDVPYFNIAKWMSDFLRAKIIDNSNFNVSIIAQQTPFDIEIKEFDVSGTLILTTLETISDEDYGLYRVSPTIGFQALTSFFTIQAQILGGNITSELFTVDVDNDCGVTAPAAATNLAAVTASASQIDLTWTDNTGGLASYQVFRGTVSGSLVLVATLGIVTSYSDTGLLSNTEFFYEVRGFIGSSFGAFSNEASDTTDVVPFVWTSRTSAVNSNWADVMFAEGLYVAVAVGGGGDRVQTSPDGITWTGRTAAEANGWQAIAYDGSQFAACAGSGANRIMTSPDGITWTARAASAAINWKGIAFGNSIWVAVGTASPFAMSSSDAITWTSRAGQSQTWNDVVFAEGIFVAVGDSGVMTSPDGITWTSRTQSAALQWQSIAHGNGLFVAVANDGGAGSGVMTSPNGIDWTTQSQATSKTWFNVTFGDGDESGTGFVALADTGISSERCMTSPDGITWTTVAPTADVLWNALGFGNDLFVALSSGTTDAMTGTGDIV